MNLPAQQQTFQLPAHLAQFQSRQLSKMVAANIGTSAPPFISIQGNKFTLVDAAGNEIPAGAYDPAVGIYLDATIIDVNDHLSKVYYTDKFDPNAQTFQPPGCWSDNGIGPSRQASTPQNGVCGTCHHNEWGSATSAVSGKGIKACHDQQKVAMLVPGHQTLFLLRIPPNSLKNFRAYAEQFNGQQFDMDLMTTRISFEQQGVGTLLFNAVGWIDQNVAATIQQVRQGNATDALVGRTDQPRDPASIGVVQAGASSPVAPAQPQGQPGVVGGQPAFVPAQPIPQAPVAPLAVFQPAPSQVTAPQGAPMASEPTQRRRRRTQAEMQAAQQGQGQPASAQPPQAPFPHPGQQAQPAFQLAPASVVAPVAPQPNFGMATPGAPDPGLMATLQNIFPPRQ